MRVIEQAATMQLRAKSGAVDVASVGAQHKRRTLLAVCSSTFMLLVDITIVNVALPKLQVGLNASFTDLQWVIDAYALMLAAALLTAGSLADLLGRKRVFVIGICLFTLASLLCGVATTPLFLVLARAVQGLGGAIMFAPSLALLAREFEGSERATAFGIWGAATGAAIAVGPLVGGALASTLGWRSTFLVNLPIGAALVALSVRSLRESRDVRRTRIDWPGLATSSGGVFLLLLAVMRGNAEGWTSAPIVSLFAAAAVLIAAFVVVEQRTEEPMLDLRLFRVPAFTGVQTTAFALSSSIFALFLYLTLYLQNGLHYSAFQAGLRFLPITVLSFVVAPPAARLALRIPVRLLLGGGLATIGAGLLLMHGIDASSRWTALLPGFVLAGIGVGLVNAPLASAAIATVDARRGGTASGANAMFRQLGIAGGIAALGAFFQHHSQVRVTEKLVELGWPSDVAARLGGLVGAGRVRDAILSAHPVVRGTIASTSREAFISGLDTLFVIGAAVAFTGAVLAFLLVRER